MSSSSSKTSSGPDKVLEFKAFGERPARGRDTHLYIGSKTDARAEQLLREKQITHILNCTPTRNLDPEAGCPNFFESHTHTQGFRLTYKRIPIFDNRGEDILQYMEGAISFMEQAKHYGSVLVHCNKGVSRSASFVLGYLMKTGNMRLDEALSYLKDKRKIIQPNESFLAQLKKYDEMLEAKRKEKETKKEKDTHTHTHTHTHKEEKEKEKRKIGPAIGPALPPHLQKKQKEEVPVSVNESESEPKKRKIGAVQGPSLPPPPSASSSTSTDTHTHTHKPSIGPSLPPSSSKAVIGPALPPARKGGAATKEGEEDTHTHTHKPSIGPALPPGRKGPTKE